MTMDPKDVVLNIDNIFDNKNFENNQIKGKLSGLDKKPYYACVQDNILTIYTESTTSAGTIKTLYDLVTDSITNYKMVQGKVPDDVECVEFYLVSSDNEINGIDEFNVGDNKYVFPSLSINDIDKMILEEKITSTLPPQPPTKEEEENARANALIENYRKNGNNSNRKGLPNSTIIGGLSQQNACYINAMLQMLIDIDEFLEYILLMSKTTKDIEHAKLVAERAEYTEAFNKYALDVQQIDEANINELLSLVYKVVTGNDMSNMSDFTNLDNQHLVAAQFLLNFTTNISGEVKTSVDVYEKGDRVEKTMSEEQVKIYKKYFDDSGGKDNKIVPTLDFAELHNTLKSLIHINTKLQVFEKKHETIQKLKQIFEYIIDGKSVDKTVDIIKTVQDVQMVIGVTPGAQEDASAIYSLLNTVFEDELYHKNGVYVDGELISPYNLQNGHGKQKMSEIVNNIGTKSDQTNIIFGNQYPPDIQTDRIILGDKTFDVAGIVQHLGDSGATGGHYIYYSFKTGKVFNDSSVSELSADDKTKVRTNFVALYERIDNHQSVVSSGGSRKRHNKFRVSRRKLRKPLTQ